MDLNESWVSDYCVISVVKNLTVFLSNSQRSSCKISPSMSPSTGLGRRQSRSLRFQGQWPGGRPCRPYALLSWPWKISKQCWERPWEWHETVTVVLLYSVMSSTTNPIYRTSIFLTVTANLLYEWDSTSWAQNSSYAGVSNVLGTDCDGRLSYCMHWLVRTLAVDMEGRSIDKPWTSISGVFAFPTDIKMTALTAMRAILIDRRWKCCFLSTTGAGSSLTGKLLCSRIYNNSRLTGISDSTVWATLVLRYWLHTSNSYLGECPRVSRNEGLPIFRVQIFQEHSRDCTSDLLFF